MTTITTTRTLTLPQIGPVPLTLTDRGAGPAVLLLHGGGGPQTVEVFAELLATDHGVRVLTPVHPGFAGTPRPDRIDSIAVLARLYAQLLSELGLAAVTVVGNSIGGWIAAEIALLDTHTVARVVLVDAVGLDLPATPIVDFFALSMDQVVNLSYANPDAFRIDPATLSEPAQAVMAANRVALRTYGGTTMTDPTLLTRLPGATVPALAIWGAADRIVPPEHGHAYAHAIPHARLELIPDAGHLPQLETPDTLARLVMH
ncbi:MAG: alpha/beta fold hydrolase [Acidimicrobiales bacterium]